MASLPPGPRAIVEVVARASPRVELAVEEPPQRRFINVCVTRDDKEALDAVQAWWSFRQGRRVPHWELFNLLLAEALENESGRFRGMSLRSWF